MKNFRKLGSALKRKSTGHPRSARIPENIEQIRQPVEASPHRPAHKHAVAMHLSDRTVQRILHFDLHFHPYKMAIVQQLKPQDYARRTTFSEQMID